MPDRIIRASILSSEKVNTLNWGAEIFYRRLMSIVDDYGRCEFNKLLLRSQLYPLKVDRVSVSDIDKWSTECVEAGLVRLYTISNKEYMELLDFNQRLRIKQSKFPSPTSADISQHTSPETKRNETEEETKLKMNSEKPPPPNPLLQHYPPGVAILTNDEHGKAVTSDSFFIEGCVRRDIKQETIQNAIEKFNAHRNEQGKMSNGIDYRSHFFSWVDKGCHLKNDTLPAQPGISESAKNLKQALAKNANNQNTTPQS